MALWKVTDSNLNVVKKEQKNSPIKKKAAAKRYSKNNVKILSHGLTHRVIENPVH